MKQTAPPSWSRRILGAIAVVLLMAAGARVVYELLAPLIPWLVIIGLLNVIYIVVSRREKKGR